MADSVQTSAPLRKTRLHDEKGNRISIFQLHEVVLACTLKSSQKLIDRPYLPWVPFAVIRQFKRILNRNSRVLEYGSGRSTIWLARHSQFVISIEDFRPWYDKVSQLFQKLGLDNIDYRFRSGEDYTSASGFADESFDLIIIDGSYRSRCLENAHRKLKPGGYLYLDNSDTDMAKPGDMRRAEGLMRQLAEQWSSSIEFFTGFSPGNLHAHQGALLRRPLNTHSPKF